MSFGLGFYVELAGTEQFSQQSLCALLLLLSDQSKGLCATMNTALEFSFLEEGFSAKDIVEQKIKESSMTVNVLCI